MTFGAQLFLLAALAAIIPVILHMVNRQRAKHLPFPTLRFLRISVEKTRRRKRIHDVLLLMLRAMLLVLIAVGLARPTVTNLSALLGGTRSAVAIILDNSASMGVIDHGRSRLETAAGAAGQVLEELKEGEDEVALLPTNGPALTKEEQLDRSQAEARRVLSQCRVSYERADLAAKMRQARKLLTKSAAVNKQIYVISDLQALSWEGLKKEEEAAGGAEEKKKESADEARPSAAEEAEKASPSVAEEEKEGLQIPIILVDCHRAPKPNVSVQSVTLETAVPVAGLPVKASVVLWNTSSVPRQPRVELYLDGTKEASSAELNIPAEGRLSHDFLFTFQRGGLRRGEVRLAGDEGSKFDDRRFFTMEIDQGIPVAVVKPQRHEISYLEDTFYLEQALSPGKSGGWALQMSTLTAGDLMSEPLENYKVIFCVNLPAPNADVAERLRSFVEQGGSLVWICGDKVNPETYNEMNQGAGGKLLPAPLVDVRAAGPQANRDSWHISFLDKQYPALKSLVEPAALYESVLVFKHVRIDAGSVPKVLARLDDGEALLVERSVGQGKVLMWGSGVHVAWSNVPLRKIFMPLFAQLTFHLAGAEQARHEAFAGTPLMLHFDQQSHPLGVEVLPPSGETLRLNTKDAPDGKGQIFRYADTHEIGVYVLRLLEATRPTQIAYAVNVDPAEADPAKIEPAELQQRLGRTPLVLADNPDDLSATFLLLREGKSLWSLFLAAVLIGLVFETFLSNRLSPKQQE